MLDLRIFGHEPVDASKVFVGALYLGPLGMKAEHVEGLDFRNLIRSNPRAILGSLWSGSLFPGFLRSWCLDSIALIPEV